MYTESKKKQEEGESEMRKEWVSRSFFDGRSKWTRG
jgi:hypothetical protein